ncbi:DUF1627 domain-containing protein [Salmonella enterica subsp. enterica serovar Cerro]
MFHSHRKSFHRLFIQAWGQSHQFVYCNLYALCLHHGSWRHTIQRNYTTRVCAALRELNKHRDIVRQIMFRRLS